jgi:hypothetical protein
VFPDLDGNGRAFKGATRQASGRLESFLHPVKACKAIAEKPSEMPSFSVTVTVAHDC